MMKQAIDKLIMLRILSNNHNSLVFHAWGKRQFKSDVSTDRWRKWNSKRKVPKEKNITDTEQNRTDKGTNVCTNDVQTFDVFWGMYPKKVGKQAAKIAWNKIKSPSKILSKITSSLQRQTSSEQWTIENGIS